MIRWCGLVACLLACNVWAESEVADKRASLARAPELTDAADYFALNGPVIDRVTTRDTDKFERDIWRIGTMLHYESRHEYMAVGVSRDDFRQGQWSATVDSLVMAGRRTDRRTAEGVTGRLALTTNTRKPEWHGEGVWNIRFGERTGMELIGSRDAVETKAALQQGILSNFVALSLDHALSERLTAIAMPTYQHYSDGNVQRGWRGWLIYSLLPDYGVSVEIKARAYDSSGDSQGRYFNPDHYQRQEAGLRFRHAVGDWRILASAGAGREWINRDIEKPTASFSLTAQRSFANNISVGAQFSYYRAANSGTDVDSTDQYAWRMGRVYVAIPY